MINDLRNLLINRCDDQLEKLTQKYNQIRFYKDRTETYTISFTNSKHLSDIDDMEQRISEYIIRYKNQSLFKRASSINEYKRGLRELQTRLTTLKSEISNLPKPEYYDNQQQLASMISELHKKIEYLSGANTLTKLGMTLSEAIEMLNKNDIPFCLDDTDKASAALENEYYHDNKRYNEISELVLVHKTPFAPNKDVIKSNINSNAFFEKTFVLNKISKTYNITDFRNTIHFCLNGEVTSHAYGNFDNRKYAVLQPLTDELATQIKGFNPSDTYFENQVILKGAYILCPIEEREEVSRRNPSSMIIPYKGDSVDKFADAFVTILGYQCEKVGMWNWQNETADFRRIDHQIIDKYKFEYTQHSQSEDSERENSLRVNDRFNKFLDFVFETIRKTGLNPYTVYDQFSNLIYENSAHIDCHDTAGKAAAFEDIDNVFKNSSIGSLDAEALLSTLTNKGLNQDAYAFWQSIIKRDIDYYNEHDRYTGYGLSDLYRKVLYVKKLIDSDLITYPVDKLMDAEKRASETKGTHKS